MTDFSKIINRQRRLFATGRTKDINFRLKVLLRLDAWLKENDRAIAAALRTDLNKPLFEAYGTETGVVIDDLRHMIKHLRRWAKPKTVMTGLKNFPAYGKIHAEPYGVALIMSPWNYPFMLTLVPLAAAIGAGNCAVVKPSAYAPATSALIARMCDELFHPAHVAVVEGGRAENQGLLEQKFDKIFFTGSTEVGRLVMESAAKNLTPITLELGGKSPCIVDKSANLKLAAKRIVWGKFLNAGQTCVAPDYLLVHSSIKEKFMHELSAAIIRQYSLTPLNEHFPKIINAKHFTRLTGLMKNQSIAFGGGYNTDTQQIEPTLIDEPSWDSPIMTEEIFGPILPVLTYDKPAEAINLITARPKPLACYLFTTNKETENYFLKRIAFGGGCVNDTVVHLSEPNLPFGGVGDSGMGSYHGKAGFDAFTYNRSVLYKSNLIDIPLRYAPYTKFAEIAVKLITNL